jgi:prophage DNA circulation protein
MKFKNMTDEEVMDALKKIAELLRAEAKFIDEMARGTFKLPRDLLDRAQVIESHKRIMAKLQKEADEMYQALLDRWRVFTT